MAHALDASASSAPPHVATDGHGAAFQRVLDAIDEATARTWRLVDPVRDDDWMRSHDPVMGPIGWDVGHMGNQEEYWLVQRLGDADPILADGARIYDAYRTPRPLRALLPLMDRSAVKAYRAEVRARSRASLEAALRQRTSPTETIIPAETIISTDEVGPPTNFDPSQGDDPLYLAWMIALHEQQHTETICQALNRFPDGRYVPAVHEPCPAVPATMSREQRLAPLERFVHHEGGRFLQGLPPTRGTYDNEWPQHELTLDPFWLAATPVTNGQWLRFMQAGGYDDAMHWDPAGHRAVLERGWRYPMNWRPSPQGWWLREGARWVPLTDALDRPVIHVTWYEADAFARWAGARLPTEAEWEYAATWDPATASKSVYPWGNEAPTPAHANLDQRRWGTDPIGSHPSGTSPAGVQQLIGDAWEWTATVFDAYQGFRPYPYDDYSARFCDTGLRVLRGGSWATRPGLLLGTFRNWDLPIRRQVFAGLRLAMTAPPGPDPDAPPPQPSSLPL